MKKFTITCIVLAVIAVIAGGGAIVYGVYRNNWDWTVIKDVAMQNYYENTNMTVYENETEFDKITVDANNTSVKIVKGESFRIDYTDFDKYPLVIDIVDNALKINRDRIKWYDSFNKNWRAKAIITVPYEVSNIDVDTSNGSISIDGIGNEYSSLILESSNGSLNIKSCVFNSVSLSSSNGSVNIDDSVIESVISDTSNGSNNITGSTIKTIETETSNSSINFKSSSINSVKAETSSGSINIENFECINAVLNTSDASVNLTDINARNIVASTSNASINCNKLNVDDQLVLKTSNSKIKAQDVTADKVTMMTSNGKIEAYVTSRSISAITSNSDIILYVSGDKSKYNISLIGMRQNEQYKGSNSDYNITANTSSGICKLNFI